MSIPYGRHSLSEEDRRAVADVLGSDWLTQGPEVGRFERAVADYCGARFAVAVNSGTSALHIACLAAGLGKGDRLWTSPNTFVASANCGLYCGGEVDFVDIDPGTCNLSVPALEDKLREADRKGALPKVLVPVHFAGQSCEMEPISRAAERYGVTVIEDACHAVGGGYKGTRVGGCAFSAMTVFSFHPVKIVTTAEGGMVLTNREELYEKLVRLRSHGITRDPSRMVGDCDGPWYYQQIDLGFNYRMTDLQAALGRSQLRRIGEFVDRRRRIAERYMGAMEGWPATYPVQHEDARSAWHLFVIRLKTGEIRTTRREVFEALRAAGIQVNVHYIPVHTQPFYRRLGFREGDFPEAERYYREAISIPLYFGLSEPDQEYVIAKVREALR